MAQYILGRHARVLLWHILGSQALLQAFVCVLKILGYPLSLLATLAAVAFVTPAILWRNLFTASRGVSNSRHPVWSGVSSRPASCRAQRIVSTACNALRTVLNLHGSSLGGSGALLSQNLAAARPVATVPLSTVAASTSAQAASAIAAQSALRGSVGPAQSHGDSVATTATPTTTSTTSTITTSAASAVGRPSWAGAQFRRRPKGDSKALPSSGSGGAVSVAATAAAASAIAASSRGSGSYTSALGRGFPSLKAPVGLSRCTIAEDEPFPPPNTQVVMELQEKTVRVGGRRLRYRGYRPTDRVVLPYTTHVTTSGMTGPAGGTAIAIPRQQQQQQQQPGAHYSAGAAGPADGGFGATTAAAVAAAIARGAGSQFHQYHQQHQPYHSLTQQPNLNLNPSPNLNPHSLHWLGHQGGGVPNPSTGHQTNTALPGAPSPAGFASGTAAGSGHVRMNIKVPWAHPSDLMHLTRRGYAPPGGAAAAGAFGGVAGGGGGGVGLLESLNAALASGSGYMVVGAAVRPGCILLQLHLMPVRSAAAAAGTGRGGGRGNAGGGVMGGAWAGGGGRRTGTAEEVEDGMVAVRRSTGDSEGAGGGAVMLATQLARGVAAALSAAQTRQRHGLPPPPPPPQHENQEQGGKTLLEQQQQRQHTHGLEHESLTALPPGGGARMLVDIDLRLAYSVGFDPACTDWVASPVRPSSAAPAALGAAALPAAGGEEAKGGAAEAGEGSRAEKAASVYGAESALAATPASAAAAPAAENEIESQDGDEEEVEGQRGSALLWLRRFTGDGADHKHGPDAAIRFSTACPILVLETRGPVGCLPGGTGAATLLSLRVRLGDTASAERLLWELRQLAVALEPVQQPEAPEPQQREHEAAAQDVAPEQWHLAANCLGRSLQAALLQVTMADPATLQLDVAVAGCAAAMEAAACRLAQLSLELWSGDWCLGQVPYVLVHGGGGADSPWAQLPPWPLPLDGLEADDADHLPVRGGGGGGGGVGAAAVVEAFTAELRELSYAAAEDDGEECVRQLCDDLSTLEVYASSQRLRSGGGGGGGGGGGTFCAGASLYAESLSHTATQGGHASASAAAVAMVETASETAADAVAAKGSGGDPALLPGSLDLTHALLAHLAAAGASRPEQHRSMTVIGANLLSYAVLHGLPYMSCFVRDCLTALGCGLVEADELSAEAAAAASAVAAADTAVATGSGDGLFPPGDAVVQAADGAAADGPTGETDPRDVRCSGTGLTDAAITTAHDGARVVGASGGAAVGGRLGADADLDEGLPLLHLAVLSGSLSVVHLVLRWAASEGLSADWAEQRHRGLTALDLAAAEVEADERDAGSGSAYGGFLDAGSGARCGAGGERPEAGGGRDRVYLEAVALLIRSVLPAAHDLHSLSRGLGAQKDSALGMGNRGFMDGYSGGFGREGQLRSPSSSPELPQAPRTPQPGPLLAACKPATSHPHPHEKPQTATGKGGAREYWGPFDTAAVAAAAVAVEGCASDAAPASAACRQPLRPARLSSRHPLLVCLLGYPDPQLEAQFRIFDLPFEAQMMSYWVSLMCMLLVTALLRRFRTAGELAASSGSGGGGGGGGADASEMLVSLVFSWPYVVLAVALRLRPAWVHRYMRSWWLLCSAARLSTKPLCAAGVLPLPRSMVVYTRTGVTLVTDTLLPALCERLNGAPGLALRALDMVAVFYFVLSIGVADTPLHAAVYAGLRSALYVFSAAAAERYRRARFEAALVAAVRAGGGGAGAGADAGAQAARCAGAPGAGVRPWPVGAAPTASGAAEGTYACSAPGDCQLGYSQGVWAWKAGAYGMGGGRG